MGANPDGEDFDEFKGALGARGGKGGKDGGGGGGGTWPDLPPSVDWTAAGAVNAIKNQGGCGSCYAFSANGAMEGRIFIATGTLPKLSEQQHVSCTRNLGNYGCNGGWMHNCFSYAKTNAMALASEYPYTGRDDACNVPVPGTYTISGYGHTVRGSPKDLAVKLQDGPVSIALEAGNSAFMYYSSGVIKRGCRTRLDHAITLTGYGTTASGTPYWIAANSWGTGWGDRGYVKFYRTLSEGTSGTCGIHLHNGYPTV